MYGKLIYDEKAKNIQKGKDSLFNKWCWENWIFTGKRVKLDPQIVPSQKLNNYQKNIGKNLPNIDLDNDILI